MCDSSDKVTAVFGGSLSQRLMRTFSLGDQGPVYLIDCVLRFGTCLDGIKDTLHVI
jgi:hypothetical protein